MQKSLLFIFALVMCLGVFSQSKEPNRISEDKVRKKVLEKFKTQHPEVNEAIWYPYPNRYWKNEEGATPFYFPVLYTNHTPDYFEVRFSDDRGKLRKVYDRTGVLQVTSREVQAATLPNAAKEQLTAKGYADWSLVKIEKLTKSGVQGSYYKVWLRQEKKNRILFFDNQGKITGTSKFDNDINFYAKDNAKLKEAPGTGKRRIAASEVPTVVKNKARKNHANFEIIEWVEYTRIYDPFQTGDTRSYYDLALPAFYQVYFNDGSQKYVATYHANGELLEEAEIVLKGKLPKAVKAAMKAKLYKDWKFNKEHDKILLEDGRAVYRIYAYADGELKMAILNEQGTYAIN